MPRIIRILMFLAAVMAAGCNSMRDNLGRFNSYFEQGNIAQASEFSSSLVKGGTSPSNNDVVWMLQTGSLERLEKDYQKSNEYFDRAEALIKHYREKSDKNVENLWAVATNDTGLAYKGQVYDGIMLNTYKAINYMVTGDFESARVEFNRAIDRQRRAKEYFDAELDKKKEKLAKENSAGYQNATSDKNLSILYQNYPELKNFEPYPDFINPFATYMAGLFFYLEGDYAKADFLIKQSAGMVDNNEYILEDLRHIEAGEPVQDTLWVVFENGLGPVKDEFRIDLPIFLATNQVQYVGIALPKLRTRREACPYLIVNDGQSNYNTVMLGSMERVVETEFAKEYQEIFIRAVTSATTKAVMQYSMYKNQGSTGALLAAAYSFATTTADCRIWSTLPKNFQLLRMNKPASGNIRITPASNGYQASKDICVQPEGNTILYVRMIGPAIEPVYEIINF